MQLWVELVAPAMLLDAERPPFEGVEEEEEAAEVEGHVVGVDYPPLLRGPKQHGEEFAEVQREEREELLAYLLHLDSGERLDVHLLEGVEVVQEELPFRPELPARGAPVEQLLPLQLQRHVTVPLARPLAPPRVLLLHPHLSS